MTNFSTERELTKPNKNELMKIKKIGFLSFLNKELVFFFNAFLKKEYWFILGLYDIKNRYRRTMLGPWWLVISNFVIIIGLAVVGAALYNRDLTTYLPGLAVGMIIWQVIVGCLNEGCLALTQQAHVIKCLKIDYYSHILKTVSKYFIIFTHNIFIYFLICICVKNEMGYKTFLFIPGFIVLFFFLVFVVTIFSIVGARFRDFSLAVISMTAMLIFITPVMWSPEQLGDKAYLAYINPLTHILDLVKAPLLNNYPSSTSVYVSVFLLFFTGLFAFIIMGKYKNRIPFWM